MKKFLGSINWRTRTTASFWVFMVWCTGNAWASGLGFQDFPVLNTIFAKVDLAAVIVGELSCVLFLKKHWVAYNGDKDPEAGSKIMKGFRFHDRYCLDRDLGALHLQYMVLSAGGDFPHGCLDPAGSTIRIYSMKLRRRFPFIIALVSLLYLGWAMIAHAGVIGASPEDMSNGIDQFLQKHAWHWVVRPLAVWSRSFS